LRNGKIPSPEEGYSHFLAAQGGSKMKRRGLWLAILAFILVPNVLFAGIYKCVDGNGNVTFSASQKPGCTLIGGPPEPELPQSSAESEPLQGSAEMERLALLIGNSNYTHGGSLDNPVNDVRAIKRALEGLGFTVMKYENSSQKAMKRAMDKFGRKLKGKNVGLFFYAGHGVQVRGHNYLLPADAKLDNANDAEYDCVRADRVLAKMETAGSRTNIVILDACRNNPFERSWRRGTEGTGLAFMNAPSGSLIAYSTAPGKTALDGGGKNSPYTAALLQHLSTPNITVLQMFQRVRSTVKDGSGGQQTPWESTSLMGNFYFASKGEERDRLEQERRELQRMRSEIEKNKREPQEKRVEVASVPEKPSDSTSPSSDIIGRDGQYVAYRNGIVKDTNTGLEWVAGPNKKTSWYKANRWVKSLTLDGGGWRMPSKSELGTIHNEKTGNRGISFLFKNTYICIWSNKIDGSRYAWWLVFFQDKTYGERKPINHPYKDGGAFAVRQSNR
jgi:hypothetical protein